MIRDIYAAIEAERMTKCHRRDAAGNEPTKWIAIVGSEFGAVAEQVVVIAAPTSGADTVTDARVALEEYLRGLTAHCVEWLSRIEAEAESDTCREPLRAGLRGVDSRRLPDGTNYRP